MTFREHVAGITGWLTNATAAKYEVGQKEHGGELWRKRGMLAHVEAEHLDSGVYLYTLRSQLAEALALLEAGHLRAGADAIRAILGDAQQ